MVLSYIYGNISYWAWFGTLYLIILTYQDFKHNMEIDDRKNYFMMGVTMSLISHVSQKIWYLLFLIAIITALLLFCKKYKIFGEGYISSFVLIFLGIGIISLCYLVTFLIIFLISSVLYIGLAKIIMKGNKRIPFFGAILVIYAASMFIFGLY